MVGPSLGDDLDRPLGLDLDRDRKPRWPMRRIALGAVSVLALTIAALAYSTLDFSGGRSIALAPIEVAPPAPEAAAQVVTAAPDTKAQTSADITGSIAPPSRSTAAEIEGRSGVKVTRPDGAAPSGALIIEVPPDPVSQLTPAPAQRLVERPPAGPLPKIGRDGSRPADVYSRPVVMPGSLKAGAPRIALLVGGMGLNAASTAQALADLPADVTLGFAPYGAQADKLAAEARAKGHEIVLQIPMEPFDYPANDPGPQTLLTGDRPAQNLTRLHWLMSRLQGYVGIVNYLGGKFTAQREALEPVLQEIADRGLIYADDGTSTRSTADAIAANLALPSVHTDVVIDAIERPDAIDAALARLEEKARHDGVAVGSATGLPLTLDRIARWSHGLESRGVALIPISAATSRQHDLSADGAQNGR
jgi:polysaccharide deacetylase 2 family uncharacterized protein YibQ